MKRCVFILPWFGPLRNYFDLFLRTCGSNREYDWLLITDQEIKDAPDNVRVIAMTFDDFQRMVQAKFDFQVALGKPYKICDFKPAFGYIFEEVIAGYEYWGHCDCDLVFGRLAPLLEPLFDEDYDKVFGAGHMTIYKNSRANNRRFMLEDREGVSMHRIACSRNGVFAFDEATYCRNAHTLFLEQGAKVYEKDLSFNASTSYFALRREVLNPVNRRWEAEKERPRAIWLDDQGVAALYKSEKGDDVRRFTYIHLQGRTMDMPDAGALGDCVQILPDRFLTVDGPRDESGVPSGLQMLCSWPKAAYQTLRRVKHRYLNVSSDPASFDPYLPYL